METLYAAIGTAQEAWRDPVMRKLAYEWLAIWVVFTAILRVSFYFIFERYDLNGIRRK